MTQDHEVLKLEEYKPADLAPSELREDHAEYIFSEYGDKIEVSPPSFATNGRWELRPRGWVGYLPVAPDFGVSLRPRVPIGNLFRMLEYAYKLGSFRDFPGVTGASSIEDFFENLADILARKTLERARRGFYRAYILESDRLPYLRGTVDLRDRLRRPWSPRLRCEFEENTADVEENQILAWTLLRVARSGIGRQKVLNRVRKAFRSVSSFSSLQPIAPEVCIDRLYNRLNEDYAAMHALCRFFLENTGPTHEAGDRRMIPFIVNMPRLFELFVSEWLKENRPPFLSVDPKESVWVGPKKDLRFEIDIVLADSQSGEPFAVLDTKYKTPDHNPDPADISQVVTYAELKGCRQAYLAYPKSLNPPFKELFGEIEVASVTFDLSGDIDVGGAAFLEVISRPLTEYEGVSD